jgi:hypothetical protein
MTTIQREKIEKYIQNRVKKFLDEMSTTGGVAGYNSPAAFTSNTKKVAKDMENQGYEVVDKNPNVATNKQTRKMKNRGYEGGKVIDMIVSKTLGEAKYSDYKKDPENSPKQKINSAITSLNGMLARIENTIDQNLKLKTEYKLTTDHYWSSTKSNLNKMEAKLARIINKLKKFQ